MRYDKKNKKRYLYRNNKFLNIICILINMLIVKKRINTGFKRKANNPVIT